MAGDGMSSPPSVVVAVYETDEQARLALATLEEAGVPPERISIVGAGEQADDVVPMEQGSSATAAGAGRGAVIGGIAGVVLMVLPGGPVLVGGFLAAAAAGAFAGAELGILSQLGVPSSVVPDFEEDLTDGRYLVCVHGGIEETRHVRGVLDMTDNESLQIYGAGG
ncbi:MAG: general stress protein [Actinomycetota bacterium]